MSEKLLEVRGLKTVFPTEEGEMPAVDGVSFDLAAGEVLAIVGESGCGKSVTSMSILRLVPSPGKIREGQILYKGEDLLKKSTKEMNQIRGEEISMIFQEPMTSLNPVFTVGHQIMESLLYHGEKDRARARSRAVEMLRMVGFSTPEKAIGYFPSQLSGGMRQRVMIAMALACQPRILIADEPTTALDVTIQAQILGLLKKLQEQTEAAIIMITHDLGIVAQIAHNVMVMYAGQAVEYAPVRELYKNPLHPYTKGLLQSIPKINEEQETLYNIPGMVPGPGDYPEGCRFCPRCGHAGERCRREAPPYVECGEGHRVRCWLYERGKL